MPKVVVIGGGNSALEEALYLSEICPTVNLIVRSNQLKGEETLTKGSLNWLSNKPCFDIIYFIGEGEGSINAISDNIWIYSYKPQPAQKLSRL